MKKLCIHIYTSYEENDEQKKVWNAEIKTDAETVHSVFANDKIIDLRIPVLNGKKYRKDYIDQCIEPLVNESLEEYEACYIVLNTHGAARSSDLSDEIVKKVVITVSNDEIKILGIFALQCNGLKERTFSEYRSANPCAPQHQNLRNKPSSMAILKEKLMVLKTQCQQIFPIYGFTTAYDPENKELVEKLLLEGSEPSLPVTIDKVQDENYRDLNQCIDLCRKHDKEQYDTVTNKLSKALEKITQNIRDYLEGRSALDKGSTALYKAVLRNSSYSGDNKPSFPDFNILYKRWFKEHKMSSVERLSVLQAYCDEGMKKQAKSLETSASALCLGGIGMFDQNIANTPTVDQQVPNNTSVDI